MKVLFIEAGKKYPGKVKNIKEKLPREIHILYTIQYKILAEKIKKQLGREHKILGFNQVLGCSKINLKAIPLLIGSGKFHASQLISLNKKIKEIFIYEEGAIKKLGKQEIEQIKAKEKGKMIKFLSSEKIGLLVSKKPGQNMREAEKIKRKLEDKYRDKKFYIFISDSIDTRELENFSIDFWLNLACPGISLDSSKILNYEEVEL